MNIFFYTILFALTLFSAEEIVHVAAPEAKIAALPVLLCVDTTSSSIKKSAQIIADDLSFGGQLKVTIADCAPATRKEELTAYARAGYAYVIFVQGDDELTWRVYDTVDLRMLAGKKHAHRGVVQTAHRAARVLLRAITGGERAFDAPLVYIKARGRRRGSELIIGDSTGNERRVIFSSQRTLVAPVFDPHSEQIFYSEFTPRNVRFMATDLRGRRRSVLDREGTFVGLSFGNGGMSVYCRSGEIWQSNFDAKSNVSSHERIIKQHDLCSSPQLHANGDVTFASDGGIYRFERETSRLRRLTSDGYCVSPALHEPSGDIVYARRTGGVMQLWILDAAGNHRQLTFGVNSCTDPAWAPCGTLIACVYSPNDRDEQVALVDVFTGVTKPLTPAKDRCCYPAWGNFEPGS